MLNFWLYMVIHPRAFLLFCCYFRYTSPLTMTDNYVVDWNNAESCIFPGVTRLAQTYLYLVSAKASRITGKKAYEIIILFHSLCITRRALYRKMGAVNFWESKHKLSFILHFYQNVFIWLRKTLFHIAMPHFSNNLTSNDLKMT